MAFESLFRNWGAGRQVCGYTAKVLKHLASEDTRKGVDWFERGKFGAGERAQWFTALSVPSRPGHYNHTWQLMTAHKL